LGYSYDSKNHGHVYDDDFSVDTFSSPYRHLLQVQTSADTLQRLYSNENYSVKLSKPGFVDNFLTQKVIPCE